MFEQMEMLILIGVLHWAELYQNITQYPGNMCCAGKGTQTTNILVKCSTTELHLYFSTVFVCQLKIIF